MPPTPRDSARRPSWLATLSVAIFVHNRPRPARGLASRPNQRACRRDMRDGEIPGTWPDPVSILSRSWLEPKNPSNSASQAPLRAHPYYITHASDNATIPRASETLNNWQVDGLNNFRQNTQGNLGQLNVADLTVELADLESLCELQGGMADLSAEVCNRGTNPVQDGVIVEFLETTDPNAPVEDAVVVCQAVTTSCCFPANARSSSAAPSSRAAAISSWMSTPRIRLQIATPGITSAPARWASARADATSHLPSCGAEPQVLTPSGGVVTGIAADDKAGVFVSGVTGVPTFKGEGELAGRPTSQRSTAKLARQHGSARHRGTQHQWARSRSREVAVGTPSAPRRRWTS
jgi:hypothetical protein